MTPQRFLQIQKKITRLQHWIRILTVLYRIFILLGLVLLILAIFLLALTPHFPAWILMVPGLLIGLGVLLAWIEYRLDNRRFFLLDRPSADDFEKGGSNSPENHHQSR
jgi:uncharacterized membrane protein